MGTCGPSLSVTIEQPASSPPQPVENGVFVAPMLPSPPPLSSELSPSFLREQIVERTVRQHEAAHAPLVQDAMRPREQPALSRVSVTFWTRMEVAGRGALAAVAAGGLHVLMQDQLAVLIIAVALLCSSANVGTSLKLSTHSVLGAVLSVPLAWLALGFMGVAPLEAAHAPACAALLGVVCAGVGYLQLPAVTRKVCLAGLALGVLLQRDAALGAALPALLALVGAVAQGALCALLSVLVPWPCLATREADARLRSAAAGAVLLLDGVLGQLGDGSGGARHWRPHTERVLSASRAELAGLPAVLEAAAWQPQLCGHRRATAWRAAQHESLVALDEGHAVLQATLHVLHSATPAALSQQLLARVRPELGPLVECARVFAAQVAGGVRPRSAELLARRCDEALLDFDDAFRQARLATVYAIGEDGAARALDTRASRDVVQTYTLLFQITNCVVVLRALSLPPPPKRRTATAVLTSALRRNAAAARAALRATVLGDGRRKHAERAKDGLRLGVAMAGAATIMLALPRGAHGVWAPVTVAFVWEPGLGASLRNSGLRLQGSVLGVFAGYLAVSAARRVQAGAARDAALLLLFGLWVSICGFVKATSARHGYAGFVAAFTASVALTGTECGGLGGAACAPGAVAAAAQGLDEAGVSQLVLDRIQRTLEGICAVLLTSVVVFPVHTPSMLYGQLADTLSSLHALFAQTHEAWVLAAAAAAGGAAAPRSERDPEPSSAAASGLSGTCLVHPAEEAAAVAAGAKGEGGAPQGAAAPSMAGGSSATATAMAEGSAEGGAGAGAGAVSGVSELQKAREEEEAPTLATAAGAGANGGVEPAMLGGVEMSARNARPSPARAAERVRRNEARRRLSSPDTSHQQMGWLLADETEGGHEGGGAHGAAALAAELLAERRALGGALQELEAMCDEAAEQPECWRAAFPAKGVHAVLAALRAMLDALGAMHTALRSLDPGRAGTSSMLLLLQPLMKPLNRLELEIAGGLRRLLQKLRVGDGAWLDWLGTATASGTEPLARIPHAQQLFEGCMEAVLNSIISSDAAGLHELQAEGLAQQGDPTLSNRDVLTFNALVHAMHSFILHMQALDRRIEDVLVMRQPLDLRRVNYV